MKGMYNMIFLLKKRSAQKKVCTTDESEYLWVVVLQLIFILLTSIFWTFYSKYIFFLLLGKINIIFF